jgi:predicted phage tail protein
MNHPEEHLRIARLAAPSDALDSRMQETFARAAGVQPAPRRATAWRWIGVFAATGIAATLAVVATRLAKLPAGATAAQTLYCIEPQGPMRQLLLETPARKRPPPHFAVSVTTQ